MTQVWALQGITEAYGEWMTLHERRRIKDLPKVNRRIAKMIGANYRIVQVTHEHSADR